MGSASVKDPDFDFTDPSRRFFLIIMAALNEYCLNLLRLHTSKAKQQRAREGRHNASVMPFGYACGGAPRQPPVIVPAEADLIRQAFEDYATGQFTDLDIAERINASGITTHRCRRRFSKDCVVDLLTNPFYMGKLPYRRRCHAARRVYDGLHTPIVSGDLFDRCRKVRETRRAGSRAMQKPWRAYLLSRLASCDTCGRKLRCQPGHSTNYYREASFQRC